jgi:hypothetical protein
MNLKNFILNLFNINSVLKFKVVGEGWNNGK